MTPIAASTPDPTSKPRSPTPAELDRFRASLGQKQAVSLAGHKWSIDRRILVPDEHLADVRAATFRAYADATQKQQ